VQLGGDRTNHSKKFSSTSVNSMSALQATDSTTRTNVLSYLWNFLPGTADADVKSNVEKRNSDILKFFFFLIVSLFQPLLFLYFSGTSWISCVQLSVWDNISGPSIQKTWIGVAKPSDELQMTVARHTLSGDLAPPDPTTITTTFQVFSKLGNFDCLIVCVLF
jgi:hypothetical protein